MISEAAPRWCTENSSMALNDKGRVKSVGLPYHKDCEACVVCLRGQDLATDAVGG